MKTDSPQSWSIPISTPVYHRIKRQRVVASVTCVTRMRAVTIPSCSYGPSTAKTIGRTSGNVLLKGGTDDVGGKELCWTSNAAADGGLLSEAQDKPVKVCRQSGLTIVDDH